MPEKQPTAGGLSCGQATPTPSCLSKSRAGKLHSRYGCYAGGCSKSAKEEKRGDAACGVQIFRRCIWRGRERRWGRASQDTFWRDAWGTNITSQSTTAIAARSALGPGALLPLVHITLGLSKRGSDDEVFWVSFLKGLHIDSRSHLASSIFAPVYHERSLRLPWVGLTPWCHKMMDRASSHSLRTTLIA